MPSGPSRYVQDEPQSNASSVNSISNSAQRSNTKYSLSELKATPQNGVLFNTRGNNANIGYILLGYCHDTKGNHYPAYFVVGTLETGIDELAELENLYSLDGKKIEDDSAQGSPGVQSRTSSAISISKLLGIVNRIQAN